MINYQTEEQLEQAAIARYKALKRAIVSEFQVMEKIQEAEAKLNAISDTLAPPLIDRDGNHVVVPEEIRHALYDAIDAVVRLRMKLIRHDGELGTFTSGRGTFILSRGSSLTKTRRRGKTSRGPRKS